MFEKYHWKHIPTGMEGTANFTAYDAHEAGCAFHNGLPEQRAKFLIDKWNTSSDWKHGLEMPRYEDEDLWQTGK